ncbi:hypothetical protein M8C21_020113, partial [Ambrosia artemisiifolia]
GRDKVELHPFWRQDELVKFCQSKFIHVSTHTPLGVPTTTPHLVYHGEIQKDQKLLVLLDCSRD